MTCLARVRYKVGVPDKKRPSAPLHGHGEGGSKKELWIAVIRQLFLDFRAVGADFRFDRNADIKEQLREHVFALVNYVAHNPNLFRIILRESASDEHLLDLVEEYIVGWDQFAMDYYRQLQELGICPSIPLSDFHAIFQGVVITRFIYGKETKLMTGRSTTDPVVIQSHVDSIVTLLLGGRESVLMPS